MEELSLKMGMEYIGKKMCDGGWGNECVWVGRCKENWGGWGRCGGSGGGGGSGGEGREPILFVIILVFTS